MLLVIDFGNTIIKSTTIDGVIVEVPHYMAIVPDIRWKEEVLGRSDSPPIDYVQYLDKPFNGRVIVTGQAARSYNIAPRPKGAARYTREYLLPVVLGQVVRQFRAEGDLSIFISHTPDDVGFRKAIKEALMGTWRVKVAGEVRTYSITEVHCFDEPLGGWANITLTEDGLEYRHKKLNGGKALVFDVGGYTTGIIGINPGGTADYGLHTSLPDMGILQVLENFHRSLRTKHRKMLQGGGGRIEDDRLRTGLIEREIVLGGYPIKCHQEAEDAIYQLLNDVYDSANSIARGFANWDYLILTGGGGALMYPYLVDRLATDGYNPDRVLKAADDERMHLANVKGGLKMWKLYQALIRR